MGTHKIGGERECEQPPLRSTLSVALTKATCRSPLQRCSRASQGRLV